MKRVPLFAALLTFALITVSMSAAPPLPQVPPAPQLPQAPVEPKRSILLGSWKGEVDGFTEIWTFKDDGTASIETKTKDGERQNLGVGKWYLKGNGFWITITEENGQALEERQRTGAYT